MLKSAPAGRCDAPSASALAVTSENLNSTIIARSDSLLYQTLGVIIVRPLVVLLCVLFMAPAFADNKVCTLNDEYWVSQELPQLKSWKAIHNSFRKYTPQCDDGFYGEGYTEAVVVLLSQNWPSLPELAPIAKLDPKFNIFVLRHINASADPDNLQRLLALTANQCPPEYKKICKSIHTAANSAIKEL